MDDKHMINHYRSKINYVGWVNQGNLGDDTALNVTRIFFNSYQFIPFIPSRNRFIRLSEQLSQITFFGGGTLLPHTVPYVPRTRYNYAFGVGVRNPTFWGKFDSSIIDRMQSFDFRFLGVRGNISRALLKDWGLDPEVIGDPCLSLKTNLQNKSKKEKLIAINVGSDGVLWGNDQERVLIEMKNFCDFLKEKGYCIILVPFCIQDLWYISRLSALAKIKVYDRWFDIGSVINFIAVCKILIGERLHSLVFSAATHTPFICLEYRPKCFDFSESVGFADFSIRTNEITSEKIMELFENLLTSYEIMQKELIRRVNYYRQKQKEFAAKIKSDIESLPDDKLQISFLKQKTNIVFWNFDMFLSSSFFNIWRIWNKVYLRVIRYLS